VALRVRRRTHGPSGDSRVPTFAASETAPDPADRRLSRQTWSLDEGPTGAPAIVVATMEAAPAPMATRFGHNGSEPAVAEREPTQVAPRRPLGPVELPPRRRLSGATLAALGVATGLAAIALGTWAVVENGFSDDSTATASTPADSVQQIIALMSKPTTATLPLQKSGGRVLLVVGAEGNGVLVLKRLAAAPAGKTYQAWVGPKLGALESAALFSGTQPVVPLTASVPSGAVVAMTLERAGGAVAPSRTPKLIAKRP
jgi:Anti-sigma-K factor rskA